MASCVRCGGTQELERDHIIRRADGGPDTKKNKRWLCRACHDYRHCRDGILSEVEKRLAQVEAGFGNQAQLTMWVFRLGILEFLNTPEKIRERGYWSYGKIAESHYSRWYEAIKMQRWTGPRGTSPFKALLVDNSSQTLLVRASVGVDSSNSPAS